MISYNYAAAERAATDSQFIKDRGSTEIKYLIGDPMLMRETAEMVSCQMRAHVM